MKNAIAFKYCKKGCGTDYYYGYSVEQTIGTLEFDDKLNAFTIILFDDINSLITKTKSFDKVMVAYLFRTVYKDEVFSEVAALKNNKRFVTIGMGAHPSGDPIGTLDYFDYAIVGDCEYTFQELVKNITENATDFKIKGIWYKKDGEIINGGKAKPVDLNNIPPFSPKHHLFAPIEITRGCPWRCKFCCIPYVYGNKPRHRSIEEIINWVEIAKKTCGTKVINFLTPNSFCYGSVNGRKIMIDKIEELLQSLAKIDNVKIIFGNYLSNARPDYVSEELLKIIKTYTQTPTIHLGGQSGSNRILELSRVGYTVEDVKNAVREVRKNGFNVQVDIIYGLPFETYEDRRQTLELINFLIRHRAKPRIHTFVPLPGTPFANEPQNRISPVYKKIFRRLATDDKVMIPFEYEEQKCYK